MCTEPNTNLHGKATHFEQRMQWSESSSEIHCVITVAQSLERMMTEGAVVMAEMEALRPKRVISLGDSFHDRGARGRP